MMDIPFETFANLVYRLSHPPKSKTSQRPLGPSKIFASWLNHLPRPFPPGTGKHIFRLLFPHEGSRRRYGLKETKLAVELERILGIDGLRRWDAVGWGEVGTGCLGKELERIMRGRIASGSKTKSSITIAQVDRLLDELAALSPFSQLSQAPSTSRTQSEILARLFRDSDMSPYALALMAQIILRDLRPLLNPLPSLRVCNPTAMLRLKSNAGPDQLELLAAMRVWDPRMAQLYINGQGNIDWCAKQVENAKDDWLMSERGPVVGVNVQIPKCLKGRSVDDALNQFRSRHMDGSKTEVWAETKYDGYRMQIHVDFDIDGKPRIKIFSKSKRDSTYDRLNAHAIILAALGLDIPVHLPCHPALLSRSGRAAASSAFLTSVILEAEVVPYNEGHREGNRGPGVEEFWWLGPAGVVASDPQSRRVDDRHRHLCLFFFDILHLNGQSLLHEPLRERRRLLEKNVRIIPGFSELAEYTRIPLTRDRDVATGLLQAVFDRCTRSREEGLVLKTADSSYMDYRWPWVKLKRDYIPDLGDCLDLVLLGAGWDLDRARELRVDTSVLTTFYIGVLTNQAKVKARKETPHFEMLFRASYGLDRHALEMINENVRHGRWRTKPYDRDDPFKRRLLGLSWTYKIPREMSSPSVLFEQPLCAEVMGAGFQKLMGSHLYELRWPRLQKIHEHRERSWVEAVTSTELIRVARQALGYDVHRMDAGPHMNTSPLDDSIRNLWRSSSTAALTDVPDFPTPSPERPSPRRMQSAPNLLSPLKSSPPSPIFAKAARPKGPRRRLDTVLSPTDPNLPLATRHTMSFCDKGLSPGRSREVGDAAPVDVPVGRPNKRSKLSLGPSGISGDEKAPRLKPRKLTARLRNFFGQTRL